MTTERGLFGRETRFVFILAPLIFWSGCILRAQSGYVAPTAEHEGHRGVAVEAGADVLSSPSDGTTWGGGVAARAKFAGELRQIALAPELVAVTGLAKRVTPYVRAGFHLVQLEAADGGPTGIDMLSPHGEIGVMVGFGGIRERCSDFFPYQSRKFISVSVAAERDVRFGSPPDETYIMALIGFGSKAGAGRCPNQE